MRILNNLTSTDEKGLQGTTLARLHCDVDVDTLLSMASLGDREEAVRSIGEQVVQHFENLEISDAN